MGDTGSDSPKGAEGGPGADPPKLTELLHRAEHQVLFLRSRLYFTQGGKRECEAGHAPKPEDRRGAAVLDGGRCV
jgi:hypothetical protein